MPFTVVCVTTPFKSLLLQVQLLNKLAPYLCSNKISALFSLSLTDLYEHLEAAILTV